MLLNLIPFQLFSEPRPGQVSNFLITHGISSEYVGAYPNPSELEIRFQPNGLSIPILVKEEKAGNVVTSRIASMVRMNTKVESIIGQPIDPSRVYYVGSSARTYWADIEVLKRVPYLSVNGVDLEFQFDKNNSQIGRQIFIFDFPNNQVRFGMGDGSYSVHPVDLSNPSDVVIGYGWGIDVDITDLPRNPFTNTSAILMDQGFVGGIYDEGSVEFTSFENKRYYQYSYRLQDVQFENQEEVQYNGNVNTNLGSSIGSAYGIDLNVKPVPFVLDKVYKFSTLVRRDVNTYDDGRVEGYQFFFTGKVHLPIDIGTNVEPQFTITLTNTKGQKISEETVIPSYDEEGNFVASPSKFWQKTLITHRNVDFSDVENATVDVTFVNIDEVSQVAMRMMNHGFRDPYLTFRDVKNAAFNLLASYNVTDGVDFTQVLNSRVLSLEAVDPYDINPETGEFYAKNTKCILEGKEESGWTNTTTIYYDRIDFAEVCSGLFFFDQINDWRNRTVHQFLREYNARTSESFINPEDFVDGPLTGPFGRDVILVVGNNSLVFKAGSTGTLGDRNINPVAQYDGMSVNGFLNPNGDLRYVNVLYRGSLERTSGTIRAASIGYAAWNRPGVSYATNEFPPGFSPKSPYTAFAEPEKFVAPNTYRGEISLYSSRTETGNNNEYIMTEDKSFCIDFFIKPSGATFTDKKCVWVGFTGFAIGSIGINNAVAYCYKNPSAIIPIAQATNEETYVRIVKEKGSLALKIYFNDVLVVNNPDPTGIFPRVGVVNIGGCYQGSGSNNWSNLITSNPENTLNFKIAEARVMTGFDIAPVGIPTEPMAFEV